jgi:hypothetical protein
MLTPNIFWNITFFVPKWDRNGTENLPGKKHTLLAFDFTFNKCTVHLWNTNKWLNWCQISKTVSKIFYKWHFKHPQNYFENTLIFCAYSVPFFVTVVTLTVVHKHPSVVHTDEFKTKIMNENESSMSKYHLY